MAALSHQTFTSFSDEVQSSGSLSSPGGLQPGPHDSGRSKPESGKPPTCLDDQHKPSELLEKKFSCKWINYLKSKKSNSGQYPLDTKLQTEITLVSDEELSALQSFCTMKINLIHHRANSKEKKSGGHKLPLGLDAGTSERDALNYTVPHELWNRICFKNVRTTLKQVATVKQHISSCCPDCNRKRAELAQYTFLKQKKTLLESFLLQAKIDEHLHTKDFLTFIAQAHRGLPKLSDDPRIIWKRLNEKSQIRSGFERSGTEQRK